MRFWNVALLSFSFLVLIGGMPSSAYAATASEIQAQIDARNAEIRALEADIASFQKELDVLGGKRTTLQSAVNQLALSQKQLAAQISVTENKIGAANLEIQQLSFSIEDKEAGIAANQAAIGKALRSIAEGEQESLIVRLVGTESLGEAWQTADEMAQFNRALTDDVRDLRETRTALEENRDEAAAVRAELIALKNQLATQKRSVDASKAAQQNLLAQTKNQEANYQKLIKDKLAAQASFEQELFELEGQLNLIVNPGSLPKVGTGVLSWPFSLSFMNACASRKGVFGNSFCITQYFGNTAFATKNPQIYNGKGHTAIDIGVSVGTPVLSALSGTVLDTGNTDLARGCYSFGKWVMIEHGNGLNTLYSHLSTIDVAKGQRVSTGQILGLSGMTGYATGPHLHFGVYASQGTQVQTLRQFRGATGGCADAKMPVATLDAYLNPLSYL